MSKVTYFERDEQEVNLDRDKEIEDGTKKLEESLIKTLSNDAKVTDKKIETEDIGNGRIRLKVTFVVEQSII